MVCDNPFVLQLKAQPLLLVPRISHRRRRKKGRIHGIGYLNQGEDVPTRRVPIAIERDSKLFGSRLVISMLR
jgi:hypothetical protein